MKRSKLNTKIGFISSLVVACSLMLASCDTFEADPDLQVPEVELVGGELMVMTNGSTFIDLAASVKSNVPVNFSVTSQVQKGSLTDLGSGLLQYQPTVGVQTGRDSFVFSVFSESNQLIIKDTIVIVVVNDSTQLPCGVYTGNDYVYGFTGGSPIINVLANDFICSIDSVDIRVSIHRADENFPPYFGTASVVDNKIVYNADASFQTADKVVYKIESTSDASLVSYGLVYITNEASCSPVANNDIFAIDSLYRIGESVFIPTFNNDQLCTATLNPQILISRQPTFGNISITTGGFLYTIIADTLLADENFEDSFVYELCDGDRCSSGQVSLYTLSGPDDNCSLKAVADSIDLSGNTFSPANLDVLANDAICDSLKTFRITVFPTNGKVTIQGSSIVYERDLSKPEDDELEYEICDALGCSSATVFIKRE